MSLAALLVAAIAVVPAFGLAAYTWVALNRANDDLRSFIGFEGMHFDDPM